VLEDLGHHAHSRAAAEHSLERFTTLVYPLGVGLASTGLGHVL